MSDPSTDIGKIITGPRGRDAIHIAVAPATAIERLAPGTHVGVNGIEASVRIKPHVGIVDPFLDRMVFPEEKFWLFLYPNTITSLRHEWTHPAFGADAAPEAQKSREASEQWLRDWCASADCPGYDAVMGRLMAEDSGCSWSDEYMHFDGQDAHGDIPEEFYAHAEIVLGRKLKWKPTGFSCSC